MRKDASRALRRKGSPMRLTPVSPGAWCRPLPWSAIRPRRTHLSTCLVAIATLNVAYPPVHAKGNSGVIHQLLAATGCPHCALMVGAGTTFWRWHWTDGIVTPVMLEMDQSRWELGVFRFSADQYLKYPGFPPRTISAHPYWGFSAMRRWQVLHRARWKIYFGLGAAYRSETDLLEPMHWNLAYLIGIRYTLKPNAFLEFSMRHWSDVWIRKPNRGQNMVVLAAGFQ